VHVVRELVELYQMCQPIDFGSLDETPSRSTFAYFAFSRISKFRARSEILHFTESGVVPIEE
jgi:hypothetical protein